MATKKQKEELLAVLKFTPRTYTITISGYGGETYAGVVSRQEYDFFKSRKVDIAQYAWDWDDDKWSDIPHNMRPFDPGSPYDCDNLFHASGADLSDSSYITVSDENNGTYWESRAGWDELTNAGVTVDSMSCTELADLDEGDIVFWGGSGEKGTFFEGEIELTEPFDPRKLTIYYEDCDDWCLITSVEYAGAEIDGSNGYSTSGKWSDAKWIIVGDGEEVYEGVERDDDFDPESIQEEAEEELKSSDIVADTPFMALAKALVEQREWKDISVKPPAKGTYECKFVDAVWPLGKERSAEWTGRSWRENGKKAPEMTGWRVVDPD